MFFTDIRYINAENNQPVTPNPSRPVGAAETSFAQSIQDATRQSGQQQTALNTQPRAAQPATAENIRAQAGALPGVTPLTSGELDLRQTMSELRARQLVNLMAGRMTIPASIADYPQTAVSYAGYLASQVTHAGFALPDSPARVLSTPRRGADMQAVKPVGARSSAVSSQRLEGRG